MAGVAFETAEQVINDAAVELGIYSSDSSDPFASTDPDVLQLCRLITGVGRDLVKVRPWTHLQKRTTISISNGDYQYDLATDFDRYINNSGWNQTTDMKLIGPLSAEHWEQFQALSTSAVTATYFRIVNNEVQLYPTPSSSQTLAYAYVSSYWVKESGQSAPNATRVDDDDDTLHFEPRLLVSGLKLAYLRAAGFPTEAAERDYQSRLSQTAGSDGASPSLSISPSGNDGFIGRGNIPDGGYGS